MIEMEAENYIGVTPDTAENSRLATDSFPEVLPCLHEKVVDPSDEPKGAFVDDPDPVENARLEENLKRLRGLA